jgi:hypothetical protein
MFLFLKKCVSIDPIRLGVSSPALEEGGEIKITSL